MLRLIQGFGVGGEWGGAVLMVTEHAPDGKRGRYGACVQVGVPAGLLLATVAFLLVDSLTNERVHRRGAGASRSCCRSCSSPSGCSSA